jgi:hypothetical protein
MLVKIDGGPHHWLEERGPRLHLLAAIDDATSKLLAAVFREQEDAVGYFQLVEQLAQCYGRPLALYHDRHEIFPKQRTFKESDSPEGQLAGRAALSQFERLLEELEAMQNGSPHHPSPLHVSVLRFLYARVQRGFCWAGLGGPTTSISYLWERALRRLMASSGRSPMAARPSDNSSK